jgi:large-conductance mechanosensitive channel
MLKEFKEFRSQSNVVRHGGWHHHMFISLNGERCGSLAQAKQAGAPTINFGLFINNVISFLIVAFALFIHGVQSYEQSPPPSRHLHERWS